VTAALRLMRLEVRRNAMPWMLPLLAGLFWFVVYRRSLTFPPLWSVRAAWMQTAIVSVFVPTAVGAAAWMGAREARHDMLDLLATTTRPRWARQLCTWAATTGWALVAYACCVAFLYSSAAREASWGGPLWWPAGVGAATVPACTALGYAAGALRPSRFTAPLGAVTAFLGLEITANFIHGFHSYWQISPLVSVPWNLGPDTGLGTFYPYLSDLARIQIASLGGLVLAALGLLGLPTGSGGRPLRRVAAIVCAVGVLTAAGAVVLAGTGRLDPHGMIAIPATHDDADDRPTAYTPVCSTASIPVCVHPAYASYLPAVTAALEPILAEIAGLPGAPVRIEQTSPVYAPGSEGDNDIRVSRSSPAMVDAAEVYRLLLPSQVPGPHFTAAGLAAALRADSGHDIVANVIGATRKPTSAQQAVISAITGTADHEPDAPIAAAARRFAALSSAQRRAWLMQNLARLRAGQITLAQMP
jgi:hypothetical protein